MSKNISPYFIMETNKKKKYTLLVLPASRTAEIIKIECYLFHMVNSVKKELIFLVHPTSQKTE